MYLEYFHLSEKPFNITPNPRFVFLSKNHREVFAHLLYGIRRHAGFIEVTGEVGTGKTTVLRTLFKELEKEECRIAYIFNPCLSARELLREICREFSLVAGESAGDLHASLNTFLLQENAAGRTVVLVIDEAQNLEPEVLEQIRLLSNLETETDKLIQIVLVGQPELGELLGRPGLRQLNQRITVRYHLRAMDEEDTVSYIQHRLGVAGWKGTSLFDDEAMRFVYQQTKGNPRLINVLCDRALLVGYAEGKGKIGLQEICLAKQELHRHERRPRLSPQVVVAIAFVLALLSTWWFVPWRKLTESFSSGGAVVSAPPATEAPQAALAQLLLPERKSAGASVATILRVWGSAGLGRDVGELTELLDLARVRGFEVARLQGGISSLRQLDLPVILELIRDGQKSYVTLLGVKDATLRVGQDVNGELDVPWSSLEPLWSGTAYLLWRNPLKLATADLQARDAGQITRLQTLLQQSGSDIKRTGHYDARTKDAVSAFQRTRGLASTGQPGVETLICLYQASGRYAYPSLRQGGRSF